VEPVGQVADVDVLQVGAVHIEQTLISESTKFRSKSKSQKSSKNL
jgi:hypothetical protein